jgi:hypothetical protein
MPLSLFVIGIVSVMTPVRSVRCGKWRSGVSSTRPLRMRILLSKIKSAAPKIIDGLALTQQ